MLFRSLSAESKDLSRKLHDLSSSLGMGAPYSVTRLTTAREFVRGRYASVPKGGEVRATFKLLRDEFVDPLVEGILKADLEVNGVPLEVAEVKIGRKDYENLLLRSPVARRVIFKLITNTILDKEFPPPLPHVLERPFEAWNSNAPEELRLPGTLVRHLYLAEPENPTWFKEAVVELWFGDERVVRESWLGRLSYSMRRLDAYVGRMAAALMRFAEFSGLGRRTTMGFGVVAVRLHPHRKGRSKRGSA